MVDGGHCADLLQQLTALQTTKRKDLKGGTVLPGDLIKIHNI